MRFSTLPITLGILIGAALRYTMAHGDWNLFFNPWFTMFSNGQPWL